MISEKTKGVPYGISDLEKIRFKNKYFVDKTRFIPQLENHDYIFFIRPRRFGKSLDKATPVSGKTVAFQPLGDADASIQKQMPKYLT